MSESPRRSAAPDDGEPCNCANPVSRADGPDDRRADEPLGLEFGEYEVSRVAGVGPCIRVGTSMREPPLRRGRTQIFDGRTDVLAAVPRLQSAQRRERFCFQAKRE